MSTGVEFISLADDCRCTLANCPAYKATRKLARLQPRQAVAAAREETPSSPFVLQLANVTFSDPRYRRSGAATVFIKHILERTPPIDGKPHWDRPVMGIINILAGILQANSQTEDAAILREVHESYPNLMQIVSRDFQFLNGSGQHYDARRSIVSKMINLFAQFPNMKRNMYEETTLKTVIHCWLDTPADSPNQKSTRNAVVQMFSREDFWGNAPPPDFLDIAFRAYKITTFVSKVNFNLKNKKLLGESLETEIRLIGLFVSSEEPFYPHIIQAKIPKQIALSLRRHLKSEMVENTQQTLSVLEQGGIFAQHLLSLSNRMETFTEILKTPHMVEAGIEGFKLANKLQPTQETAWYEIFDKIKHTMTCTNRGGCEYYATPEFLDAAKTSLERVAITTMRSLEDDSGEGTRYMFLWYNLMKVLGITPQSIRERYRIDKKCCNLTCPARLSGVRSEKKHTCTVCHSVFYCDRACQKSDWENHKGECDRLSNETEGTI